eukprot:scpid92984/ scgid18798/ Muscleblind-like protein 2a; Tmbnl2a
MAGTSKDSSWLRLEVCRQFSRGRCSRSDSECKFAHPPASLESFGGTVTACFDFLKKRCRRENCRFYHPPEHIVTQLVTTGGSFSSGSASSELSFEAAQLMGRQDKSDRLEVCREYIRKSCQRTDDQCRYAHPPEHIQMDSRDYTVTVCMDFMKGRCSREKCRYFHPLPHLQHRVKQQQAPGSAAGSSAMLMEQILLNARKRPSSTPADVLSNDYRRPTMPYTHPAASAAAAAAAAVGQTQFATIPQAQYDPAAYAAYAAAAAAAGGQQQQQQQQQQMMMAAVLQGLAGGQTDVYSQYATAAAAAAAASAALASNPIGWLPGTAGAPASAAFVPEPVGGIASLMPASSSQQQSGDTLPLCMDFRAGKCTRRTCRYAHPADHVTVDNKAVRICRDYQRGRCQRPECRFYHMEASN